MAVTKNTCVIDWPVKTRKIDASDRPMIAAKTQNTYEQGSAGAEIVKELKQRG